MVFYNGLGLEEAPTRVLNLLYKMTKDDEINSKYFDGKHAFVFREEEGDVHVRVDNRSLYEDKSLKVISPRTDLLVCSESEEATNRIWRKIFERIEKKFYQREAA